MIVKLHQIADAVTDQDLPLSAPGGTIHYYDVERVIRLGWQCIARPADEPVAPQEFDPFAMSARYGVENGAVEWLVDDPANVKVEDTYLFLLLFPTVADGGPTDPKCVAIRPFRAYLMGNDGKTLDSLL